MSDAELDGELTLDGVFPEEPRPPSPEPTIAVYERRVHPRDGDTSADKIDWKEVKIRLVGAHPLWGHHLWNAARSFTTYLDTNPALYAGRNVLELGAGGGLPGLVCALNGASNVVLTDYPDADLVGNLEENVKANVPAHRAKRIFVHGYVWGHSIDPLLASLPGADAKFDLIIMSDLIFNHSQHDALLDSCARALAENPRASTTPLAAANPDHVEASRRPAAPCLLVFYTHHRPHLAARDMEFFTKAQERGWVCKKVVTERFPVMFPEDPGEEEVRATVHGWVLTR